MVHVSHHHASPATSPVHHHHTAIVIIFAPHTTSSNQKYPSYLTSLVPHRHTSLPQHHLLPSLFSLLTYHLPVKHQTHSRKHASHHQHIGHHLPHPTRTLVFGVMRISDVLVAINSPFDTNRPYLPFCPSPDMSRK